MLLLDRAVIDVNKQDSSGWTALRHAVDSSFLPYKSRLETAKLPLARDYINNMNLPDRNGWSPLFFAADTHDFPMVDLLLTKNDPNVRNIDGV